MTTRKPKAQTIKIGPMVYAVNDVDRLQGNDGVTALNGEIDYHKCTIQLDKALSPQFRHMVLWHEVLHGILHQGGDRGEHDEVLLDQLAHGIMQVLEDNPILRSLT